MPVLVPDAVLESNITMDNAKRGSSSGFYSDSEVIFNKNETFDLPFVSVPEKIVICIDIAEDPNLVPYLRSDNTTCRPFDVLKKALELFAFNKLCLNPDHELAFVTVEPGGFKWISDFSSNLQKIGDAIDSLNPVEQIEPGYCNFTPVFKEVKSKVGTLPINENNNELPKHIIRLFIIYNSSMNKPKFNRDDESYKSLISSDNVVVDLLYLHDPVSKEYHPQEIYNILLSFIKRGSYFEEESRKVTKVFNAFSRYLAHPLQRTCNETERQLMELYDNNN
ncbi:hypothetical protein LSTR_LSTR000369 [Laodelphax striatellus]|uniref:BRISC and BRCA1-A complex member 1 n=1 Tax=Laodelphax striatellus TaxID=195883 RepID=A0A482X513_LAOST|nr:hypothetical protein LSTR_LSTR000369 [Laodelphax striatellus]